MRRLFDSRMARYVSRGMGLLADTRFPDAVLKPFIEAYSIALDVDRDGVVEPPGGFRTFGDFFARRMEEDARPVPSDRSALVSPCDGELTSYGFIEQGGFSYFEVKGFRYSLHELLGSTLSADRFEGGGGYAVIYLHPRDYHRVHAPVGGDLSLVRRIPGSIYPVAPWSERRIDGILGKNERVIFELTAGGGGAVTVVMVAAYGVSNISTEWGPRASSRAATVKTYDPPEPVDLAADLGAFRLGSTVVILWKKGSVKLVDDLSVGRLRLGQRLGTAGL